MGVLVPRHRSILAKIDICLVFCGSLIFLSSRGCDARTFASEISVDVNLDVNAESLKKLSEVSQPDGQLKNSQHIDEIRERKLPPTSEFSGKSEKVNADVKLRGVTGTHDTENHKKVQVEEIVDSTLKELHNKQAHKEEQKSYKRLLKTPIRRFKRDIVDEQKPQIDSKSVEEKASKFDNDLGKVKGVNVEGIRRLDVNVEEENKNENEKISKIDVKTESRNIETSSVINSQIDQVDSSKQVLTVTSQITEDVQINGESRKNISIPENSTAPIIEPADLNKTPVNISEPSLKSSIDSSTQNDNSQAIDSRATQLSRLQYLKNQALEFQKKIQDKVFLQNFKDPMLEILPDIPKFTEDQFLDILKMGVIKKNIQVSTDIDFEIDKDSSLSDSQKEIIKYTQKFVAPERRQSFFKNLSECIASFSIFNCMRIFIYPILVDNLPEALLDRLPTFPIEINVDDVFPRSSERQKLGRQVPIISFYTNPIDPDSMVLDILMEGLLKNPPNENLISYIAAKNETLTKILTCNRYQLLQLTEKFLPENSRKVYSEQMLQCLQRFEYFSCIKYFSWPEIRNYAELPQFPLGDDFLSSLAYPNYPLIVYPGSESGFIQLPEIIESGPRYRPETVIISILRQTFNEQPRFTTLPTPVQLDLLLRSPEITQEQLTSIHIAEQLLPVSIRSQYVFNAVECMKQFGYYNCMKYGTWPTVRQWNPSLPRFPTFQDVIENIQNLPVFQSIFNMFSQFHLPQFPQFAAPQWPFPTFPNFTVPNFLNFTVSDLNNFTIPSFPNFNNFTIPGFPNFTNPNFNNFTIPNFNNFTIPNFNNFTIPNFPNFTAPNFNNFTIPGFPNFTAPNFSNLTIPSFPNIFNLFTFGQRPAKGDTPYGKIKLSTIPMENKIYNILKDVRDSLGATPLSPPTYTNRKIFLFPLMSEEQSRIFAIAESIVPPLAREPLITNTYFCLSSNNMFMQCAKTIIWPALKLYVKGLSEFPTQDDVLLENSEIPSAPFTESRDNVFIMREVEKTFFNGKEDDIAFIIESIQSTPIESLNMQKIMDILRSIQVKGQDFKNMPIKRYPRKPEFSSILNESQENIVHGVESLLPDEIRSKFYRNMIDCAQKHPFSVCSRNVVLPAIYPYFQTALFISDNNVRPEKKNYSQINAADLSRIHPIFFETKINAERQGENTIITADRKISPIYPPNPELVILGMLRKIQLNAPSIPEFPKESIAYSQEFKSAYSMRQAYVLTVAEGILPHKYRAGFLNSMFQCNLKDSFLNCARDILFPLMKQAYVDFPDFPDFKNDLDRSNMISIINNLNKPLSTSSRSYDSKKTLPAIDVLLKYVQEDKNKDLKELIDKLPDTLYYDLYIKMTQCTQYSDGLSCSHDLIYPILKKYYDAPGFNLDDYYPIHAQPSFNLGIDTHSTPYDFEILCENMGFACTLVPFGSRNTDSTLALQTPNILKTSYIAFGKLSDGSRIYKQIQDTWNLNISPAVGADKSTTSGQKDQRSVPFLKSQSQQISSEEIIQDNLSRFLKRHKRNVDDLLDSYPQNIPDEKKNSVPRRIPPQSNFPNLTETELLEILLYLSKHKNNQNIENKFDKYFVDSLNETEKALITTDQYEILKLVQGLNTETAKANFMWQLFRCIRSLSFIRCVGIFVWPVIVNNFPSPFRLPFIRDSRTREEMQIEEILGMSPSEFESELVNRKEQIESNFIQWYKSLTGEKFEANVGPLKVKGHGDGELTLTFSGFRESRLAKIKDNKSLPSILTIISDVIEEVFDTKSEKTKNKKETPKKEKRTRSLHSFEESNLQELLRHKNEESNSKRLVKDDFIINMLLEKLKPTIGDIKDTEIKHYFDIENAYAAFQVLFGPKVSERIASELKFMSDKNYISQHEYDELKAIDELELVSLEVQEKNLEDTLKMSELRGRAMYEFEDDVNGTRKEMQIKERLSKFKSFLADYIQKFYSLNKKKVQSGITVRLPRLNDKIVGRRMTSSLSNLSRDIKSKVGQMMPAAGVAASFLAHLALAHAKAVASVAGILSNMALGSAMLGLIREMILGSNAEPKVKYIYENEKHDAGMSWSPINSDPTISFTPQNKIQGPAPYFSDFTK